MKQQRYYKLNIIKTPISTAINPNNLNKLEVNDVIRAFVNLVLEDCIVYTITVDGGIYSYRLYKTDFKVILDKYIDFEIIKTMPKNCFVRSRNFL